MNLSIPILDLSQVNINLDASKVDSSTFQRVGKDLTQALFDVGFLYVTNHGVSSDTIHSSCKAGKDFFRLPRDCKQQRYRNWEKTRCGYLPIPDDDLQLDNEIFDLSKPADVKEVMDVCHSCEDSVWPDKELPGFKQTSFELITASQNLITRLLLLLGHGMTPDKPTTFTDGFKGFSSQCNTSQLRYLYYPKMGTGIKGGQSRCGEHTDYGCVTLVYMDSTPGLQVYTRQGFYVDVERVEGAVLVNIGDLMQRWSGDQLRSAKHRVVFRPDTLSSDRYSLVYFSHPDEDTVISPIDGLAETLEKYPAVVTRDHMNRRFKDTFKLGKGLDEQLTV